MLNSSSLLYLSYSSLLSWAIFRRLAAAMRIQGVGSFEALQHQLRSPQLTKYSSVAFPNERHAAEHPHSKTRPLRSPSWWPLIKGDEEDSTSTASHHNIITTRATAIPTR